MEHLEFRSAGTSEGALRCLPLRVLVIVRGSSSGSSSEMSEGALRCLLVKDSVIMDGCSMDGCSGDDWRTVDESPK